MEERKYRENNTDDERINNLFEKRFSILEDESYLMPPVESMFISDTWTIEELQIMKDELNEVKNRLSNYNLYKWHAHTTLRNSAKDVIRRVRREIQPEFLTQAWCKFYEIVSSYPLVPIDRINKKDFKSIHLCEAPGAFVASLNHWIQTNEKGIHWDWIATTLNPYYEGNQLSFMINDDRFMRPTLDHWCFGEDNTGNIMLLKNLDNLVEVSKPHDNIFLVTADGSIDCLDTPGEQENMVAHLHYCEAIAAFHVLAPGGCFLLKIFTTFECHTVCLLYLLSCCFNKISLFKPATSKEGNSETYVICIDFKGKTALSKYMDIFRIHYESGLRKVMFQKESIPETFIKKLIECSAFFKTQQCLVITQNIVSFERNHDSSMLDKVKRLQWAVADKYMTRYKLRKLKSGEILRNLGQENSNISICKRVLQDSYNERCKKKSLNPQDKLNQCLEESYNIKIHIQPQNSVTFSMARVPDELKICVGKSFSKVYSSRFCDAMALRLLNDIENIILELGLEVEFPATTADLEKTIKINSKYTVLHFKYTEPHDSHKTITIIYDKLQNLETGETLILTGYSLLTHFNVGLLHLLGCSFNSIEFQMHTVLGCQITLKEYNYSMRLMKHLIDIKIASHNCVEGKSVLEILPISFLYDSEIFPTIVCMNNWVIKVYIESVVHSAKSKEDVL